MKPLKFRVWYSRSDGYGTPVMIYSGNSHNLFYEFFEQSCPDEDKAMQFTGLEDKNGREIYEGDYVKIQHVHTTPEGGIDVDTNTYKVVWDPLELKWGLDMTVWHTARLSDYRVGIEVVGNIYQGAILK